ncbi:MAG: NAD+ synthase [Planctomycetaceae bacterium]
MIQLNPIVGDLRGNRELVRQSLHDAQAAGAELCITSELVLSGYPPKDLLLRDGFAAACDRIVDELARDCPPGIGAIIGHPTTRGVPLGRIANAASLIADGQVQATVHKSLLPNYDVFDEQRYFRPADNVCPVTFRGVRIGLHICEDAWWGESSTFYHSQPVLQPDPLAELARQGVDLFVNISASPFEIDKPHRRTGIASRHAKRHGVPFVFVNQVGGNDDLVFDGHSMVLDAQGEKIVALAGFEPDVQHLDLARLPGPLVEPDIPREEFLLQALTLGLRDYMRKCGFSECVLGLSGGIDSALAACIAARAVGPKNVHGLLMPSRYSSTHSVDDARLLAENLGIDWQIIPIDEIHKAYETTTIVHDDLASQPQGLADQNLQARIRGAIVMLRSNRYGWIPLATGNKSELAVGYCTIYGDMAGGFAVLSDLFKRDVYALSSYINEHVERREVIPAGTMHKAPSAELAPNQFDQDTLPPYPILDAILEGLIEREWSVEKLCTLYPPQTVKWVVNKLDRNEFKRRQMPPGIKLSPRAFGTGRRMPMAAKFEL